MAAPVEATQVTEHKAAKKEEKKEEKQAEESSPAGLSALLG